MTTIKQAYGELTKEVYALQDIVDERLRRLPVPFADLGVAEQVAFCDNAERSVRFELAHGETAFMGMALLVRGDGGFIVEEISEKSGLTVLHMMGGASLRGFIDEAYVWTVPPLSNVLEKRETPMSETQVSVFLHLVNAVFESSGVEFPLDKKYLTYLPLTYPGFYYDQQDLVNL